jgi:WD40 repeat protein
MFLASWSILDGSRVSLWDVTTSPSYIASRDAPLPKDRFSVPICDMAFSRDGLFLAVATEFAVEIWSVPDMGFVNAARQEDKPLSFDKVAFNYAGDKYLTVSSGKRMSTIVVWAVETGMCERRIEAPYVASARFLATDEILFLIMWRRKKPQNIEAVVLNLNTLTAYRSRIQACGVAGDSMLWDYIEQDHAVVVAYEVEDADGGNNKGGLGRWNLGNDTFEWRQERPLYIQGTSSFSPEPVVCSEGRRVAACGGRLPELTVDVLCTDSGNLLGTYLLSNCSGFPQLRFVPDNYDNIMIRWTKSTVGRPGWIKLLSVYNFVTKELSWETEFNSEEIAVQYPVGTVLM